MKSVHKSQLIDCNILHQVATFYGRMIDHDYTTKEVFNRNFFKDWRKV